MESAAVLENTLGLNRPRVAQTLAEPALTTAQQFFYFTGLTTPFSRFIFGYTIAETFMLIVKPSFSFDAQGRAKTFSLWPSKTGKNDTTMVPWFLPGLIVGGSLGLFF